jgi:hypothetical protein
MPQSLHDPSGESHRCEPLFRERTNTLFRVALTAFVLFLTTAGYAAWQYYHSPYWNRIGLAPTQPVLFSHRHHAGQLRLDCRYCHTSVENSAFAGMPSTHTCLTCHSQIFTDTAMLRPVVKSQTTHQPIPWRRVTQLPDHVYFNHSIHVAKGVSCTTCHGDVGNMAEMAKATPMTMRWCLECHRDPAGHLQSRDAVFAAHPTRAGPSRIDGEALVHASSLHVEQLTNCSTCHH